MARQRILVGNMKMNQTLTNVDEWISTAMSIGSESFQQIKTIICPQTCLINPYHKRLTNIGSAIGLGGQFCSQYTSGAFTGQNSVTALKSVGAELVLVGNSEERGYIIDDNTLFRDKIQTAIEQGVQYVVYCVGEELAEREAGLTTQVITEQITTALSETQATDMENIIMVCYEPVWAIGTGKVITPAQAQIECANIRNIIASISSQTVASKIRILFGGSVNVRNAETLLSECPDIDGFLTGGVTLRPADFAQIATIMLG